jgi:hypothetical protein
VVGQPRDERVLEGDWRELSRPNTVFLDDFGWRYIYGDVRSSAAARWRSTTRGPRSSGW